MINLSVPVELLCLQCFIILLDLSYCIIIMYISIYGLLCAVIAVVVLNKIIFFCWTDYCISEYVCVVSVLPMCRMDCLTIPMQMTRSCI